MSFWDKIAGIYDLTQAVNGRVQHKMADITAGLIKSGDKVLDVAAGTGVLSFAAAEKADKVVCTDLSVNMLKQAEKHARKRGIANIRFEARNIFHLADEDEAYDVTMAGNVLHLLDNPEAAVRELCRVTKKGGLILLPTYMLGRKTAIVELYKRFGFNPSYNFTPTSYRRMLLSTDCGEVRAKLIDGIIPCCYAVIRKRQKK